LESRGADQKGGQIEIVSGKGKRCRAEDRKTGDLCFSYHANEGCASVLWAIAIGYVLWGDVPNLLAAPVSP
jgi:hypothetical protein